MAAGSAGPAEVRMRNRKGSAQVSESGVRAAGSEPREVWLRANPRPVAGFGLLVAAGLAGLVAVPPLAGAGPIAVSLAAALGAVVAAGAAALASVALGPRLVRQGENLEVRLATTVERVPLGVVECLFRGSEPVPGPADDDDPRFRVGTLVVRLAERATDWRDRPTFRSWGSWEDGHIVIDGRWCEPLTRETVGRIAERLVAAKRESAAS